MYLPRTVAGLGCLALLVGCNTASNAPQGAPAFPPTVVKIETAQATPIEDTTEYVATLKSLRSTAVQPQIEGQVSAIFVKSGDRVGQGQRLVQIDPSRQQAAVSSQEAERAAREADVAFARRQHQRATELLAGGAISRQELEQVETALQTAEARLQSLQAQVRQQEVQLRYFTVAAPTAGVIGDVPVRVGNQVSPQTILTTIDQNDTLEVYVQVPIERARDLKLGTPIRLFSSEGEQAVGETTVAFISSRVDESMQSVLVKGLVRNPDGALRSSQFVRARVIWKTGAGIVAPVTATVRINGQYFVFVADTVKGPDGKDAMVARQRAIKVGPIAGEGYTVLEGLKAGDALVVSGAQKLADGAPIAPAS